MYLPTVRIRQARHWMRLTVLYPQGTEVERFSRKYKILSPLHKLGS